MSGTFMYTHSIVDIQWNDSVVLQHCCSPDNPEELDLPLKPVNLLLPIIRSFSEQDEKEYEVYYYHGDHLGSASWITNQNATPIQYLHYAPYGEFIANQRASGYDERFKFTGKERDAESGYNYHGARFLWGDAGFWLSVDPLVDKYIHQSPYLYCNANPIKYIDTDGRFFTFSSDAVQKQMEPILKYLKTVSPELNSLITSLSNNKDVEVLFCNSVIAAEKGEISKKHIFGLTVKKSERKECVYIPDIPGGENFIDLLNIAGEYVSINAIVAHEFGHVEDY